MHRGKTTSSKGLIVRRVFSLMKETADSAVLSTTSTNIPAPGSNANWQALDTRAGSAKNRVCDRRSDGDDRCFAGARGGQIRAIYQMNVQLGQVVQPGHSIVAEGGVEEFAIFELDLLLQGRAQPHDDGTLDLTQQIRGVHNSAALERLANTSHLERVLTAVQSHFHASRYKRAFLCPTGQPNSGVGLSSARVFRPVKLAGRGLQHGEQTRILQVSAPELKW